MSILTFDGFITPKGMLMGYGSASEGGSKGCITCLRAALRPQVNAIGQLRHR